MATVWAWRTDTGDWSKNNPDQTGWSHQVKFSDLKATSFRPGRSRMPWLPSRGLDLLAALIPMIRLSPTAGTLSVLGSHGKRALWKARTLYAINDNVKALIGADLYRGPADSVFGLLKANSLGYAEVGYSF